MIELRLFNMGITIEEYRRMSAQVGRTRRQKAWLKAGMHPATKSHLAETGETCGSCAHLVVRRRNRTYFKCGLLEETHGPGTDIRKKWPACVEWEEHDA